MTVSEAIHEHVLKVPASAWTPAVEADGEARDGAWAAELTGTLLNGWPKGMRLIVRKERPHPGAQLRITDADGMRITCFATNTTGRPIAELELRHRLRARAEDRIRAARATGLEKSAALLRRSIGSSDFRPSGARPAPRLTTETLPNELLRSLWTTPVPPLPLSGRR